MASQNNSDSIVSLSSSDLVDLVDFVGEELLNVVDRLDNEDFMKKPSVTHVNSDPEYITSLKQRFSASNDKENPDLTKDEYSDLIEHFTTRKPTRPVRVKSYKRKRDYTPLPSFYRSFFNRSAQPQPARSLEKSSDGLSLPLETDPVSSTSNSDAQQMNQEPLTHSKQLRHDRLMEQRALFKSLFGSDDEDEFPSNIETKDESVKNIVDKRQSSSNRVTKKRKMTEESNAPISQDSKKNQTTPPLPKLRLKRNSQVSKNDKNKERSGKKRSYSIISSPPLNDETIQKAAKLPKLEIRLTRLIVDTPQVQNSSSFINESLPVATQTGNNP